MVGWLDSSKHKAKDGVILHSHLDQIKLFKISNKIKQFQKVWLDPFQLDNHGHLIKDNKCNTAKSSKDIEK